MTRPARRHDKPDYALARRLAEWGYGWEDLVVEAGVSRPWAKSFILGERALHMRVAALRAKQ
jgi:hypothetical protein